MGFNRLRAHARGAHYGSRDGLDPDGGQLISASPEVDSDGFSIGRRSQCLIYGHFHQLIYEEGSGCGLLINGSIKGYDEFILKTKYSGQTPIQALLTFHPRHGLTDLSRINLGHVQGDQKAAA